jgi:hypothetical protein
MRDKGATRRGQPALIDWPHGAAPPCGRSGAARPGIEGERAQALVAVSRAGGAALARLLRSRARFVALGVRVLQHIRVVA